MRAAYDACESVGTTYLNACQYTDNVEIISYPGISEGFSIMEELLRLGSGARSCRVKNKTGNTQREKELENLFKSFWKNNESRLRVAEVIGTDSPEWEMLCRCIIDPDSQPIEVFEHVAETILNETSRCPEYDEQDGEFILQGCFSPGGRFGFDKV